MPNPTLEDLINEKYPDFKDKLSEHFKFGDSKYKESYKPDMDKSVDENLDGLNNNANNPLNSADEKTKALAGLKAIRDRRDQSFGPLDKIQGKDIIFDQPMQDQPSSKINEEADKIEQEIDPHGHALKQLSTQGSDLQKLVAPRRKYEGATIGPANPDAIKGEPVAYVGNYPIINRIPEELNREDLAKMAEGVGSAGSIAGRKAPISALDELGTKARAAMEQEMANLSRFRNSVVGEKKAAALAGSQLADKEATKEALQKTVAPAKSTAELLKEYNDPNTPQQRLNMLHQMLERRR